MNKKITFKEFAKKHYKDRPRGKEEDVVKVAKKPSLVSDERREEIRLDVAEYARRLYEAQDERISRRQTITRPPEPMISDWSIPNPVYYRPDPPSPQGDIRWVNMGLDLEPPPISRPQPSITSFSEEELRRLYSMQEPQSEVEQSDEEDDSVF